MPDLTASMDRHKAEAEQAVREPTSPSLPTDSHAAEGLAAAHMRGLGFLDARQTGTGRNSGIDIMSRDAVAQVKLLALPVGAPLVQQLRGAMPNHKHHLFYSTSGYTSSAMEFATEHAIRSL